MLRHKKEPWGRCAGSSHCHLAMIVALEAGAQPSERPYRRLSNRQAGAPIPRGRELRDVDEAGVLTGREKRENKPCPSSRDAPTNRCRMGKETYKHLGAWAIGDGRQETLDDGSWIVG